jgi:dipeptidyl-peptidase-3
LQHRTPTAVTQSAYYLDCHEISEEDIEAISGNMLSHSVLPENTRIQRRMVLGEVRYNILQAAIESDSHPQMISSSPPQVYIICGDHSNELERICRCLEKAQLYTMNLLQMNINSLLPESFTSGDLKVYKESQRL